MEPGTLTALLREVAVAPDVPEAEAASLPPGAVVGRFEIVRELGRGGFGVVYEAKDRELGRAVAVKVVRPGRVRDEEGKVAREAEAIARLAHPNLVTLHDVGWSERGPFLVFELLRGKTLDLRIEEGPLPVQEAVHVATEVARGLAHAHAEGVVHRDLKPANVFVTNKGQVKILDFGMAHAFGRRRLSGGTPAYMAPEQWEDAPEDERTDVFALGVMLYRMLTGEYPYPEGQGRWAAEPATPRKLEVPGAPELADLVERMLDPVPTHRPRDGAAVLAALAPVDDRLRARPADGKPPEHARRRKATLGDLLAELRRRHVFRVMVGYGVFAFALLQVVEPIIHGAELPGWTLKAVLAALALGFPVAVVLAWVYDLTAQGVKRTPSVAGPGGPSFGRSRMLVPLAVSTAVLVVAAVGAAGWHAWKGTSTGVPLPPADGRTVVAVADFTNRTGESQLDALTGLLVTSLEQSKRLQLLTRGRLVEVAREQRLPPGAIDEVAGRVAGRRAGASVLLVPTVHKLGSTYVVELRALDLASDRYRFTVKETAATPDALLPLIDRLSDRTRAELRESAEEVATSRVEVGKALTRSLEAYEHYLKGRELRLKQCDYVGAEREQRQALAADPEMGAARMELGVLVLQNGGPRGESTALLREARKRVASLPEKERRIVELDELVTPTAPVAGDRAVQKAQVMKGIDELLARYPIDEYVLYWAGWAYSFFGEWEKGLDSQARSLKIDPGQCHVVLGAAWNLSRLGRDPERLAILRRAVEARPNAANRAQLAVELALRQPEEASLHAREALRLAAPGQTFAVDLAACALAQTGSPDQAEMAVQRLASEGGTDASRAQGRALLSTYLALQGRPQVAFRSYEAFSPGPRVPRVNPRALLLAVGRAGHSAPLAAAELRNGPDVILKAGELALFGDLTGAAEAAVRLSPGSEPEGHYRAVRAAVEQRWDEAIPALRPLVDAWRSAAPGTGDPSYYYRLEAVMLLGEALLESGRPGEALEALARAEEPVVSCTAMAAAHLPGILMLRARAHEKLGSPADAVRALDRLLVQWKNAEPGLPLHAEAKAMRARLAPTGPPEAAPTPSIAVLPFADMSPKHDQEYFADGVAEEIRIALAHVDGLKVIGRTSSSSFKGKPDDLQSIGRKLGVANVLEGSLRKDGNAIRINVQLIRVADGTHLWAERFDRKLSGILKVQDEIARSVVGALEVKLLPGRGAGRISTRTVNVEAYRLHLLARSIVAPETPEARRRASEVWERAAQVDPGYALPHVFLAINSYNQARAASDRAEADRLEQRARVEMERALQIDPEEGTAYALRAWMRAEAWDWAGAQQDLDKAESLAADRAVIENSRAMLLATAGRLDEAVAAQRRTLELEPLAAVFHGNLAQYLLYAGRYGEAREAVRRTLEISPKLDRARRQQAILDLLEGKPEAALRGFEGGEGRAAARLRDLAIANHALGRTRESAAALADLERDHADQHFLIAEARAYRGDRDGALHSLEKAVDSRDPYLGLIKISWALRPVRGDPRYAALLRKMNLPIE